MTTKTIAFFVDSELQWTKKVSASTLANLPVFDGLDMVQSMEDCGASSKEIEAAMAAWTVTRDSDGTPVKWGLTFDGMAQYTVVLD